MFDKGKPTWGNLTWEALGRRDLLRIGSAAGLGGIALMSGLGRGARAADASKPLPIRIANATGPTISLTQGILDKLGYLPAFGVDANTVNLADGSKVVAALVSGNADVCMVAGFAQVFPAIEHGAKLKIIGGAQSKPYQAMFTTRPEIKTLKDLIGRTVAAGAPGTLYYTLLTALLQKQGIDISKLQLVNIGNTTDMFKAVVAKGVDASFADIDIYYDQAKYGVHAISDSLTWINLPEYTSQGVFASEDAIANRREALVRTLAAYCKLYRYICSPQSHDLFMSTRAVVAPNASVEAGEGLWKFDQEVRPYELNASLSEDRIRYTQQLNLSAGNQKTIMPFSQVADMSLARDALALVDKG